MLLVLGCLGSTTGMVRAAVTFAVMPAAVSNTYSGTISVLIDGLTNTETVVVQKFLDANANGVIDGSDWLVQQFALQDGQAGMVLGGVTNFNVPGDLNAAAGSIKAGLAFHNGDFLQNLIGKYLYRLSSPASHFAPLTNQFEVTNFPFPQRFTGTVVSNDTGATVPNAIVILISPHANGETGGGTVANAAGHFSLGAPPETYSLCAFQNSYLTCLPTAPVLGLSGGQTATTNLTVTHATASIAGSLVDAGNPSVKLAGVMVSAQSSSGLIGIAPTDATGSFSLGVTNGTWKLKQFTASLVIHGYAGAQTATNVTAGTTGVTLTVPKATALIYGSVKDTLGNPLPALDVYAHDNNSLYTTDVYTDANGNYVQGAMGLGPSDPWWTVANDNNQLTNYAFSPGHHDSTNVGLGQAVLRNFIGILATNQISGWLKDSQGNPLAGIEIYASARIGGLSYDQEVDTDSSGHYSLNVANGTWEVQVADWGGGDSLPANYLLPAPQNLVISNNNVVINFTTTLMTNQITGTVKDPDGNPLAGIAVAAGDVNYGHSEAHTEANGHYTLNVANGTWTVRVIDDTSVPNSALGLAAQTVVLLNSNAVVNLIAVPATQQITGSVKDTHGNPIAGAFVGATAQIKGAYGAATTDASGNFTLYVANGTWTVAVDFLPANFLIPATKTVGISGMDAVVNFVVKDNSPAPSVAFLASPASGPAPLSVQFTAPSVDSNGSTITRWKWAFGDGATSTNQSPSHVYSLASTFQPSLVATNNLGVAISASGPAIHTEIGMAGLSFLGANLMIYGNNGQSGRTYKTLMSTNLTLPLSQWTPVATSLLPASGNFTIIVTNAVNRTIRQHFYCLQQQ